MRREKLGNLYAIGGRVMRQGKDFTFRRKVLGWVLVTGWTLMLGLSVLANQDVMLGWQPSSDSGVIGYNIYYGSASHNYTNMISVGNVTNAVLPALVEGGTYYFAATTYDAANQESGFSDEASYLVPFNVLNMAPTLNAVANVVLNENAAPVAVNLSGITSGSPTEMQTLTVTAVSSNPAVIPAPLVNYASPNSTGNLILMPAFNANGTATITVTVNDGGRTNNLVTKTFLVTVNAVNQPPTLNAISNVSINQNAPAKTVVLSGISSGAANENQTLKITATSSNPALIPAPTVNYTSPDATGALTFTPAFNLTGTAIITVTLTDEGTINGAMTKTFLVTVNPVNQPPTLNALNNLKVTENATAQTVLLSGITSGAANEKQILKVTATSSNPGLISNPSVGYVSPNPTGMLTFKPTVNTIGTTTITVTVNDGGASNNIVTKQFTITVAAGTTSNAKTASTAANVTITKIAATTSVLAGQNATFSVTAAGTGPLKYQWRLNASPIASATGAILTLNKVTPAQAGTYDVTVANSSGATQAIVANLVVYSTAAATLTPAGTGYAAGQYTFAVTGVPGYQYIVQASTNYVNWVPVLTNTAPFTYVDPKAGQFRQRYYRAVWK